MISCALNRIFALDRLLLFTVISSRSAHVAS
jgi:hypothetical protein